MAQHSTFGQWEVQLVGTDLGALSIVSVDFRGDVSASNLKVQGF